MIMLPYSRLGLVVLLTLVAIAPLVVAADADEDALKKAVTLYASFDEGVKADYSGGDGTVYTGIRPEPGKPKPEPTKGADEKVFTIAKKKGVAGGCLETVDIVPNNGRIFFPAKGNIAFKKGGWGGAMSMWINFDPDKMLKTKFCDPVQITQKGANNGGIWFDFNDAKPRDMRHGCFPAVKEGEKPQSEDDPKAPMVRVPKVGFKSGDWHHIVISWKNFDTGKPDAVSQFWVDGKLIGEVKDRAIAMDWDIDKAGIFFSIGYIGLLDEFAIFNRPLTAEEIGLLQKKPGLLQPLKKAGQDGLEKSLARDVMLTDRLNFGLHGTLLFQDAVPNGERFDKAVFFKRMEEVLRQDQLVKNAKIVPPAESWVRAFLLPFLRTKSGQAMSEECLALLLRAPPPWTPRKAEPPKFPFSAKEAQEYQREFAAWLGLPVEFTNDLGMTFRLVPPGTFLMGSTETEPGRAKGSEESQQQVTLTRPFYLSTSETTVGQFRRFVEATSYVTDVEKKGGGNAHDAKANWDHRPGTQWRKPGFAGPFELKDEHPVVHVSWTDSKAFCDWLNRSFRREPTASEPTYDLPTEAQWEWACRAGSGSRFWWGADEDTTGKRLNCGDKSLKKVHPDWPRIIMPMDDGHAFLAPVGSYQSNGFGLHDMLGNAWEFCADRYRVYGKEPVTDPVGTDEKRGYAVRGGGWSNVPSDCRCASRNADPPHFGHSNLGFRVALLLPAPKEGR
jgi:formylglycine-generating enzyme required for sulfatase activity